jgi:uncharacterized protein (TIGR00730 family)
MSKKKIKPVKAYKNLKFLTSHEAREIRVLAEFIEPEARFAKYDITDTFVFFGSARIISEKEAKKNLRELKKNKENTKNYEKKLQKAQRDLEFSKYYEDALELSKRLTKWSIDIKHPERKFIVASGGGPGIMEAANRGAQAAKGRSIGMNISLPFEQYVNDYVSPELAFEFHYFFVRKFWLIYMAKALIVFPGGFGTMDELFEVLTLIQTKKIHKNMKVIIYGSEYWKNVINFDAFVEAGTISKRDLKLFDFCDTVDDAFEKITSFVTEKYLK